MKPALRTLVGVSSLLLAAAASSNAAAIGGPAQVDPAALVREVRAQEAWIGHAKSLRLKLDTESIQFPRVTVRVKGTIDLAFDSHRLYARDEAPEGNEQVSIRIWDGRQALEYERYKNGHADYALDQDVYRSVGRSFMIHLAWPASGPHEYWWVPGSSRMDEGFWGRPQDYRLAGRENVRGIDCYVLETDTFYRTLYVGVADHRLYCAKERVLPRESRTKQLQITIDLARKYGQQLSSFREIRTWEESLPAATRDQIDREYFKRLRTLSVPYVASWYSNYQQLAPNCWFPARQSYESYKPEAIAKPLVSYARVLVLTSASVNQPLPDGLFKMDFKEGVRVTDFRHDPPLIYKYKKHFTPQEWQSVLDEAQQRKSRHNARQTAMHALLGKPAPDFAGVTWVNSKPLKWEDFKGKVVLVDFWATWCVPCRNDYPKLVRLYRERAQNGLVIVGIHAAGTPVGDVRKMMKEFGMEYPVCIDTPSRSGSALGMISRAYGIPSLPQVFVVDASGKVRAHGSLAEAVAAAGRLRSGSHEPGPPHSGHQP